PQLNVLDAIALRPVSSFPTGGCSTLSGDGLRFYRLNVEPEPLGGVSFARSLSIIDTLSGIEQGAVSAPSGMSFVCPAFAPTGLVYSPVAGGRLLAAAQVMPTTPGSAPGT